jgi:hypothetical protein
VKEFNLVLQSLQNRDSSVSLVMTYDLRSQSSISTRGKRFFSVPQCQTGSRILPSLLSNGDIQNFRILVTPASCCLKRLLHCAVTSLQQDLSLREQQHVSYTTWIHLSSTTFYYESTFSWIWKRKSQKEWGMYNGELVCGPPYNIHSHYSSIPLIVD